MSLNVQLTEDLTGVVDVAVRLELTRPDDAGEASATHGVDDMLFEAPQSPAAARRVVERACADLERRLTGRLEDIAEAQRQTEALIGQLADWKRAALEAIDADAADWEANRGE